MAILTAEKRKEMPKSDFAQPEKRGFPMNDATHQRMAISGATRSEHAGNISASEADRIKAEARAKLHHSDPKGGQMDHRAAVAKMHPEHVHKVMQAAHDGKYGPEAQEHAKAAMAPQDQPQQEQPMQPKRSIFDDDDESSPAPQAPPSRASMFDGGQGGI
jgi:hypothetical protein